MKTIIKIILILLSLNSLSVAQEFNPEIDQESLRVNKKIIIFSDTKQGIVLSNNSMTISNTNPSDGIEFDLQSSCDCLKVSTERDFIFSAEKIYIRLSFDTTLYQGLTEKYFSLIYKNPASGDQEEKIIQLKIRVNVTGANKQKTIIKTTDRPGKKYDKEINFYFFYYSDCIKCYKIKKELFPEIEKKYSINLNPIKLDMDKTNNLKKLLRLKAHLKIKDSGSPVIFFDDIYIAGFKNINSRLPGLVKEFQNKKVKLLDLDRLDEKPIVSLSLIPVLLAGLLDGINPCAFATIIFLISYLNYLQKSRKTILLTGAFYTSSVFFTYMLIGLGFLKGITSFPAFHRIAQYVNLVIALFTFALAFLCLRDYFLARKGKFNEMALQLPDSFKRRIHKNIR